MPSLTALTEATETATVLAEVVGIRGLYPSSTTFPGTNVFPQAKVPPVIEPLEEV